VSQSVPLAWRRRIGWLAGFWLALGALLALRLYQVQIVHGAANAERARENTVFDEPVTPTRGRLLDDRGRLLVSNKPQYTLCVTPNHMRVAGWSLRQVGRLLHLDGHILAVRARNHARRNPWSPAEAIEALDPKQLARLAPLLGSLPGLELDVRAARRYAYGRLASHLFGYVSEISDDELARLRGPQYQPGDLIGKAGLEATYDRALRGRKGYEHVEMDATGRTLSATPGARPVPGLDLHLTLDLDLQQCAENALRKTLVELHHQNGEWSGGAVVALDPRSGAVYAMASLPDYDPRPFARGIRGNEYSALLRNPRNPLFDRAIQAAFPPGSTFKIINASACLQEKVTTPGSTFYCSGWYKGFHCFVQSGHGALTFYEAIAQSCDATFYMLGDRLGVDRLSKYAGLFGLGRKTGIDLPNEGTGILPSQKWKRKWFGEPWYEGETIVMSIGQGYLIATPLQMAVACAAVANGGKVVRPYLVDHMSTWDRRVAWRQKPSFRRLPIAPRYFAAVRQGMRGAVDHGTATAADSPLITISGKTGTAEADKTSTNPMGRNHVWFVSFAPYDHPKIVCVVMVEKAGGYGGGVAAPIARTVIERWALDHHLAKIGKKKK
jgi:penicillin-binding protein 2